MTFTSYKSPYKRCSTCTDGMCVCPRSFTYFSATACYTAFSQVKNHREAKPSGGLSDHGCPDPREVVGTHKKDGLQEPSSLLVAVDHGE